MNLAQIVALIKSIPGNAAESSLENAQRAEAAADIAENYGFTLTYTDSNIDGNIVITKSSN